eukprot:8066855-Pyramimonas_sp.AAC.1
MKLKRWPKRWAPRKQLPKGTTRTPPRPFTTGTDITHDADTPIDLRCAVTEEMALSSKRRSVYRAGSAGWVEIIIKRRLSSTKYPLSGMKKATINNLAPRKPDGIDLNHGRGLVRYGPWILAGATA